MFVRLSTAVVRFWPLWLVSWLLVLVASSWVAPKLDDVVTSGEFAFLPADSPSRRGERLFEQAWGETVPSRVVIVVSCKADGDQLNDDDRRFIDEVLSGALVELAKSMGGLAKDGESGGDTDAGDASEDRSGSAAVDSGIPSLINDVRTFSDRKIGKLLESRDGRASLVIVELTTEFLNRENRATIDAIERLIRNEVGQPAGTLWSADRPAWQQAGLKPGIVGSSNSKGEVPASNEYRPENILAMLYRHLGIDPVTTFNDVSGRPRYLLEERELVHELI